eukprot:scaffold22806_cov26-Tisochrysis_lutea.AAC.1
MHPSHSPIAIPSTSRTPPIGKASGPGPYTVVVTGTALLALTLTRGRADPGTRRPQEVAGAATSGS